MQTPFYGFDHVTLVRAHGDEPGGDYDRWLAARDPKAKALLGPEEQPAARLQGAAGLSHRDSRGALRHRRSSATAPAPICDDADADAPFFLMVSFPDPHHPFNPPGKYWDMYKPEQFPVPEAFSRNDWTPPALVRNIIKEREAGKANLTGMNTIGVSAREAQEARALTCGMIACVDDAIGGVLAALDRSGRRDDTVVIFTSDHGDHLGDHRLMLKGAEQYQSIVRVPFIWSDPQAQASRRAAERSASTMDIGATVLDRARIEPSSGMQAQQPAAGVATAVRASATACSSSTTIRHPSAGTDVPPRVHTLIDGRYRLSVFHGTGWGELYDLEGRSRRVRQPVGRSGARCRARAHDGAAAADRDRAHRPRAAAHAQGVIASGRVRSTPRANAAGLQTSAYRRGVAKKTRPPTWATSKFHVY